MTVIRIVKHGAVADILLFRYVIGCLVPLDGKIVVS